MMPFSILRVWLFGLIGMTIVIAAGYLAWD
jgi:pimeloyl-ACP methyl ester carboxylesterase